MLDGPGRGSDANLFDLVAALVARQLVAWDQAWNLPFSEVRLLGNFLSRAGGQPPGIADLEALMKAFPDKQMMGSHDERA